MRAVNIRATFRFYAELNDFLAPGRRYADFEHSFAETDTVKHVIEALGVPHTEIDLILVNGRSVPFTHTLAGGDHVSVYPVFESLDIRSLERLRPVPLRVPRFVLDGHLGRLAAYLRMLGFDTWYERDVDDVRLAEISASDHRILLTRDLELLKRSKVTHGYFVRPDNPREQLRDIVIRFDLLDGTSPFSRCMNCNATLQPVSKAEVDAELPPHTRATKNEFSRCPDCLKIYWKGSHHERMFGWINELRGRSASSKM